MAMSANGDIRNVTATVPCTWARNSCSVTLGIYPCDRPTGLRANASASNARKSSQASSVRALSAAEVHPCMWMPRYPATNRTTTMTPMMVKIFIVLLPRDEPRI
jgi:hypothetical protein